MKKETGVGCKNLTNSSRRLSSHSRWFYPVPERRPSSDPGRASLPSRWGASEEPIRVRDPITLLLSAAHIGLSAGWLLRRSQDPERGTGEVGGSPERGSPNPQHLAASTIAIFSTLHQCPSGLVFESVPLVGSMRLARTSAAASECRAPLCLDVAREPAALGSIHDSDLLLASSTPIGTCLRIGAFGLFDVPCSNQCCGIGVPRSALSRRGSRTRSTGQHPR